MSEVEQMRPTIRDVSRRAGVSIGTVSNALNAPHLVAEETRRRVMQAVEELDYRPNRAARSLAARRTHLIGYRLPDYVDGPNPTLDAFLHYLVTTAAVHGLELVLFAPQPGQSEVDAYREVIRRGAVDAFILSDTNYEDPRIEFLLEQEFPFAAFGRSRDAERFPWVDVDGAAGVERVVEHLAERGHTSIAMVAWPEGSESGDARLAGYRNAMEAAGLAPGPVLRAANYLEEGRRCYRQLVTEADGTTAVVCVQDTLALGVMMEAVADGRKVGDELAVAGFDDTPMAALVSPGLTSVRQPFEQVGEALIEMLVERLDEEDATRGVLLEPVLIPRASTTGGEQ